MPAIEGLTEENTRHCKEVTLAILEGGTQSGKTSIMIGLKHADGITSVGEMTARHLEAFYKAYLGAEERFKKDN